MKRALSLILVLAMVLCLVPFSAFAEGEEWNLNGDYNDGTVALTAAEPEQTALYTATNDGTVCFYLDVPEGVEGVNIYIDDILYEGNADIAVKAGDTFAVTVAADNGWDDATEGTVSIRSQFTHVPGTEMNPLYLSSNNTTVIVPAGSEVWYNLYGASYIVSVNQGLNEDTADFSVYHKNTDTTYAPDAANWVFDAQFNGVGNRFGMSGPDVIKITNNLDEAMYYIVKFIAPEGHQENPMPIYFMDEAVEGAVAAGSQGFYYTYNATNDGTLSVTVGAADAEGTACGWTYTVNNLTSYAYGDTQWSDSDPVVNPWVIEVSKGDEIQIIANTYDPADPYNAPAGKVSVTLSFEAAPETPVTPAEPEVAQYNGETMGLNAAIAAAAADYATDNTVKTVTLVDNFDDASATIIIEPGVLLDLGAFSITARNVIGLNGSFVTGNAPSKSGDGLDGGKIIVGRNNLSLSGEAYAVSNGAMMPVWYDGQYIFTLSQINFPAANQGGLNVDTATDNGYAKFVFKANFTSWVKTNLFSVNGTSEHAVNMIVSVSWVQDGINVTQEFTFPTDMQSAGMSSTLYGDMINCNNYENLAFKVIYVSDSGATMTSATYNYADYIS